MSDLVTDDLQEIANRLTAIDEKIDRLTGPIAEFAELVAALKANPMMAAFLTPTKKGNNGNG